MVFGGRKIVREAAEQADPIQCLQVQGQDSGHIEVEETRTFTCCIGFVRSCLVLTRSNYERPTRFCH